MKNFSPRSQAERERQIFKRYNEFRTVKVNSDRIDFDLKCEDIEKMLQKYEHFYEGISSFHFDIFDFSRTVGRNMQMPFMATAILKKNNLLQIIDFHKFLQFTT